jgi:hypothetical protein
MVWDKIVNKIDDKIDAKIWSKNDVYKWQKPVVKNRPKFIENWGSKMTL